MMRLNNHPLSVAGLHFWRVVFSRGGQTGCFVLQDKRESQQSTTHSTATQHIRVLLFLVQNCLVRVGKIHNWYNWLVIYNNYLGCSTLLYIYYSLHAINVTVVMYRSMQNVLCLALFP